MKRSGLFLLGGTLLGVVLIVFFVLRGRSIPGPIVEQGDGTEQRYRESPMLRERVERGELPSVDERLPDNPFVVTPPDGPGRYSSEPPP